VFTEALLHATGQITNDSERIIMIAGYGTVRTQRQMRITRTLNHLN
jgi:hypothetical protein